MPLNPQQEKEIGIGIGALALIGGIIFYFWHQSKQMTYPVPIANTQSITCTGVGTGTTLGVGNTTACVVAKTQCGVIAAEQTGHISQPIVPVKQVIAQPARAVINIQA